MDKFQLNETKFKELCIYSITNNTTLFDPVFVNGVSIDLDVSSKILGLNISKDLTWELSHWLHFQESQEALVWLVSV